MYLYCYNTSVCSLSVLSNVTLSYFIHTFNRRFCLLHMNVFIFRKLFLPLFTPFLKWIRVFWIEKKSHKWYLYFSFTYFFPQNLYSNMMPRLNVSLKSNCLQNMLLFILWTKGGYSSGTNDEYWWFYEVSFRFYSIQKETKSSLLKTRQGVDYSFIMSRGWVGAMSIQVKTSFLSI